MNEEQKEKWYNSFTREQLIERCEYLQRSCERKENSIMELEMEIADLEKGYCELKEKCNKGECDCTHEEYNGMCEQNIKMDLEIERLNNIINIILDFNLFKDECPLCLGYLEKCDEEKAQDVFYEEEYCENCSDDYKKCWLKYFNRLQELKGSDKE